MRPGASAATGCSVHIPVDIRGVESTFGAPEIEALAGFALRHMEVAPNCELSVSLVTSVEIHELNREYRGVDRPTDVLSFECDDPWEFDPDEDVVCIGDIIIAPEVVAAQAGGFGNTFEQEMQLMLVHGVLHVLGYDHIEDEEAEEMEALEREILAAWEVAHG